MKTPFLIIIFHFVSLHAFCQVDLNTINIIETILRKDHPTGTLFYTDRLDSGLIKRIKESLKRRKFIGQTSPSTYDTIRLSRKEKRHLIVSLNNFYSNIWTDSLFQDSKMIPKDSMWFRITKQNKEFYEQRQKARAKNNLDDYVADMVQNANTFQFSPVIFFRNKSLLVFYYLRLCGGQCGVQEFAFYKLENGEYKKSVIISGGVF